MNDFVTLVNNKEFYDVIFHVGENKVPFYAWSGILSARSEVFHRMFTSNFREGTAKRENGCMTSFPVTHVSLPDLEDHVFCQLLEFIYTGNCLIEEETVVPLFQCGDQYLLPQLKEKCLKSLEVILTQQNVLKIMNLAAICQMEELATKCLEFISVKSKEVIKEILFSEAFFEASKDCVSNLIKSDIFCIEEIDLYQLVVKWGEAELSRQMIRFEKQADSDLDSETSERQPKRRKICGDLSDLLKDVLSYLRLPIIPVTTLKEIEKEGLLAKEELHAVYAYHSLLSSSSNPSESGEASKGEQTEGKGTDEFRNLLVVPKFIEPRKKLSERRIENCTLCVVWEIDNFLQRIESGEYINRVWGTPSFSSPSSSVLSNANILKENMFYWKFVVYMSKSSPSISLYIELLNPLDSGEEILVEYDKFVIQHPVHKHKAIVRDYRVQTGKGYAKGQTGWGYFPFTSIKNLKEGGFIHDNKITIEIVFKNIKF